MLKYTFARLKNPVSSEIGNPTYKLVTPTTDKGAEVFYYQVSLPINRATRVELIVHSEAAADLICNSFRDVMIQVEDRTREASEKEHSQVTVKPLTVESIAPVIVETYIEMAKPIDQFMGDHHQFVERVRERLGVTDRQIMAMLLRLRKNGDLPRTSELVARVDSNSSLLQERCSKCDWTLRGDGFCPKCRKTWKENEKA